MESVFCSKYAFWYISLKTYLLHAFYTRIVHQIDLPPRTIVNVHLTPPPSAQHNQLPNQPQSNWVCSKVGGRQLCPVRASVHLCCAGCRHSGGTQPASQSATDSVHRFWLLLPVEQLFVILFIINKTWTNWKPTAARPGLVYFAPHFPRSPSPLDARSISGIEWW